MDQQSGRRPQGDVQQPGDADQKKFNRLPKPEETMFPDNRDQRGHNRLAKAALIAILVTATVWQCIGAWTDSQTTDEAVHLAAGYSYWQTNSHRSNPEHPPLLKLLAAAPLLVIPDLHFDTTSQTWKHIDQWGLGSDLLYHSRANPASARWILFIGRLVPIAMTIFLVWLLGWWATKRWGAWAGVIAAGLFAFDPTVLGHGHLVTTDMAVSLGFVATVILLERFIDRPTWGRAIWLATVLAATNVIKFSAIILWLIVPVVILVRALFGTPRLSWRWVGRLALVIAVIAPLLTWTVYGFEVKRFASDGRISSALAKARRHVAAADITVEPPLTKALITLGNPDTVVGRILQRAAPAPVPAYSYFSGLIDTSNHNYWGHSAFLLGQVRELGWWYYFPVAMAVKMPLIVEAVLLFTAGWGIFAWWRRKPRSWRLPASFLYLGFPPLAFLTWSLTSHINIGVRHTLPVMVFFPLWAAMLLKQAWFTPRRAMATSLGIVIVLLATSLMAWPHTLAYFNAAAGGTSQGHTILQDSNLDWNQDTWRLLNYVQTEHLGSYGLAIPGGRTELFFKNASEVPTDDQVANSLAPSGTYLISAAALYDTNNPFHWLWSKTPTKVIGSTVYRFDFR